MKEIEINVFEEVGGNAAVSSEDGDNLFKRISRALEKGSKIILNFNNIELITSSFLNSAIGQLYNKYDSSFLRTRIKVENMAQEDLELLKKVVERAKEYFKDRKMMEKGIQGALDNE